MNTAKRVLMIVTSHEKLGSTGTKTGFWLEELAAPYLELSRRGLHVDIASPHGGRPPVDPKSESQPSAAVRAFIDDQAAATKLAHSLKLSEINGDYDAYFVVGGHGVMWDLSNDSTLAALLSNGYERGSLIAAVCHGPAALVNVRLSSGRYLVGDKRVSAFSNAEEAAVGLDQVVPFALESALRDRGARYESGPLWGSFAIRDGQLITGQNPASSVAVAQAVIEALG